MTVANTCVSQGLTNPLPGRPGQVLNPAGQVCSVFTTPGRASVKKSPGQLKVRVFTVKKSDQKMSINIDNKSLLTTCLAMKTKVQNDTI